MRSNNPSWFSWPLARLWNRSPPNADRPVYIIGPDLSQPQPSNIDVAIVPSGLGAIVAQVPDGTSLGGNKRGNKAVDLQSSRSLSTSVASGSFSVIVGGTGNIASGTASVVVGGEDNNASASNSSIGGGQFNGASGTSSTVGGGSSNTAAGGNSVVSGGTTNSANGTNSAVGGGQANVASGSNSVIPGGNGGTTRSLVGRLSFSSGTFTAAGDAQYGLIVVRRETTNNTSAVLTSNGSSASSINIPAIPPTSLVSFRAQVVCIQTAGSAGAVNDGKVWEVVGAIKRDTSISTTAIFGTPTITVIAADTNLGTDNTTGAVISITADTSIVGAILINVTGETNKTLRWVATVQTTEVDY